MFNWFGVRKSVRDIAKTFKEEGRWTSDGSGLKDKKTGVTIKISPRLTKGIILPYETELDLYEVRHINNAWVKVVDSRADKEIGKVY